MCKTTISEKDCAFASIKKVIDGKETYFCCEHCSDNYEKKVRRKT
jgi:YHS domain-containing protein